MRRPMQTIVALVGLLSAAAFAAPLTLEPPPSETTTSGVLADNLTTVAVLARLHVTDPQVVELAQALATWDAARADAEKAEAGALLKARDALVAKRDTLLTGGQVPPEVRDRISAAFMPLVDPTNRMLRAERDIMPTLVRRMSPDQVLLVQWEFSGPNQAEMEQVLSAFQEQSQRLLETMQRIFRSPVSRLLSLSAPLYREQRLQLIDRMLMVADQRGVLTAYSPEQEQLRMDLIDLFDQWRQRVFDRYGTDIGPQQIDEALPYVTQDILGVLGVSITSQQPPEPIITESELKRLLLRPDTVTMLTHRAELIRQAGRRDGAMGIPPGSGGDPDWGPEPGMDGN